MARHKGVNWRLNGSETDHTVPHETIKLALLMDLRDELQGIRAILARTLGCHNFTEMPFVLKNLRDTIAPPANRRLGGCRHPDRGTLGQWRRHSLARW